MKKPHSGLKRRRALKITLGSAAALVALLAALPLWLPWALRPALQSFGIRFGAYERLSYLRFRANDVRAEFPRLTVEAKRFESALPYAWLLPATDEDAPRVTVADWTLRQKPAPSPARQPRSLLSILDRTEKSFAQLRRWLPSARLTNGLVVLPVMELAVPIAQWQEGLVSGLVRPRPLDEALAVKANVSTSANYKASIQLPSGDLAVQFGLFRATNAWMLNGAASWLTNHAELSARIEGDGRWPDEALIRAENLRLPAEVLGVRGYGPVEGSLSIVWTTNGFLADVAASAEPQDNRSQLPFLNLDLHARGTPKSATIERLSLAAPWVQAALSSPITIDREGRLSGGPASLNLMADLNKLPWAKLGGQVRGTVEITRTPSQYPQANFSLSGEELTATDWNIKLARARGRFDWPVLTLSEVRADLADGSSVSASTQFELRDRKLVGGRWEVRGPGFRRFLPGQIDYSELIAAGLCHGPLTNVAHSGQMDVTDLKVPHLRPFRCSAQWSGQNLNLSEASLQVRAGSSQLDLAGALQVGSVFSKGAPSARARQRVALLLEKLTLRRRDQPLYALAAPCSLSVDLERAANPRMRAEFKVGQLHWKGSERSLRLTGAVLWPEQGQVELGIDHFVESDFADFIEAPARGLILSELDLNANWDRGPLNFQLRLSGQLADGRSKPAALLSAHLDPPSDERARASGAEGLAAAREAPSPLSVTAHMVGDGSGVTLQPVKIMSSVAPVLTIEGAAPLALVLSNRTNWGLHLDKERAFALRAVLARPERFSWPFATGTAVVHRPTLDLAVRGTAEKPAGHLQFGADALVWQPMTNQTKELKMDDIALEVLAVENGLELQRLAGTLYGQPLSATARWPLERKDWVRFLTRGQLPDWRTAAARLQMIDAALAPLAEFAPQLLQPEGRLSVDLAVQPGLQLDGYLAVTNAATRPLAALTPIHDIGVRIKFAQQEAAIERFEGEFGGQPVRLSGRAWLSDQGQPRFALELRGSNVTLVRKSGLLLRGDVNLRLAQEEEARPKVSGKVNLRDGLFLMPVASLMPGHVSVQKPRPTSLGLTNEPFASWTVDLAITGEEFLRARTPLFSGTLSANAQVRGRLAAPAALGDVRIDSGRVRFPFGTLAIEQGYLNLSGEVTDSELFVTALGRNYNYNVRMEVKGRLEEPLVSFSSAPPLTSEQILLMLSAGEIPNDQYSFSTQAKVGQLATFLGKDLLSRWRGDDGSEERLSIRSGEDISEEGRTTYSVEYQLTDRWSLVGEYDRFSAFNAGVKWKIIAR